jgi:hypothetical protein
MSAGVGMLMLVRESILEVGVPELVHRTGLPQDLPFSGILQEAEEPHRPAAKEAG